MSHNAASEEAMGLLHARVAEVLLSQLEGRSYKDPETGDEIVVEVDPRIISSAITFLNNNKVVMNPYVSQKLTEIEQKLSDKVVRFRSVSKEAADEAKKEAGLL